MVQQTSLKNEIDEKVLECLCIAENAFKRTFPMIPIFYDLKGVVAGRHRKRYGENTLHVNWTLFVQNKEDYLTQTVPHEVAHYITSEVFPGSKSHGREWKSVMERVLGRPSKRCHKYDVSAIKRKIFGHDWNCGCSVHHISGRRHDRLLSMINRMWIDVGESLGLPMRCLRCNSRDWTYQGTSRA